MEILKSEKAYYKIVRKEGLGEGSNGKVIACYKNGVKSQLLAAKELKLDENQRSYVMEEIRIHREVNHPHVIQFVDFVETRQAIYIITEYASQGNLKQFQMKKKINDQELLNFFLQICTAVHYLHGKSIIH